MSKLRVDSITNANADGSVTLLRGATVPSGQALVVFGDMNVTGIITATTFLGDGSNLSSIGGSPTSIAQTFAWSFLFGNYHRA